MSLRSLEIQRTIEAVWRIESARLTGGLARYVRDLGLAEDLAQDALVAALEQWPQTGIPDNPGAWLMATAKHRAVDAMRRRQLADRKHEQLGRELELDRANGRPSMTGPATTCSRCCSRRATRCSRPRHGRR